MYNAFARFYDAFTQNVNYPARADYFAALIEKYGTGKGILLDLACGTGSLSFEMEKRGFDVIGTDSSTEMLDEAMAKKIEHASDTIFLNQDMTELDMFGTVTSTVCALDSLNHLDCAEKVRLVFSKVALFTEPGGVFIFDVNTRYKHRKLLADNAFIFENEDCFLAWQNERLEDDSVNMYLDIFVPAGDKYERESECITEYYYSDEVLGDALELAGFELCAVYDDLSLEAPHETSERKVFVARKLA